MQALRRAAKVHLFRNGDKMAQLAQLYIHRYAIYIDKT
jgi:hypothetical protein